MNLKFSEIIRVIESEISAQYLPGAIYWADETMGSAWSNAIDRFDQALSKAMEMFNPTYAQSEGELFKCTVIDLLRRYKKHKSMNDLESLLNSIIGKGC